MDDRNGGAILADSSLVFGGEETLYAYDATGETQRWSVELGDLQVSPAAYCDAVLAATFDNVYAIGATDGEVLWEAEATGTTGPVSVAGEMVVVAMSSRVRAFAVTDGSNRWEFDREWSKNGVCTAEGTVYVTGGDRTNGIIAAVDLESGDHRWSTRLTRTSYWPAVYHDGSVFIVDDEGTAYRTDADGGEINWKRPTADRRAPTPLVTDSLVVVGSGNADQTYALDAETGKRRWKLETGPVLAPPVAAGDEIYIGTMNRGVFALDHSGTVQWHREEPNVGSPMAVHDRALVFKSRFPNPQLYRLGP